MFLFHASCAIAGVSAFSAGVAVVMFMKKKRWWLSAHKTLGITGLLLMAAAVAGAIVMVQSWQGNHLNSPHGYLGIALVPLGMITVTLGFLRLRLKTHRAKVLMAHRVSGISVLLLIIANALGGLHIAGLLPWS